MSYAQSIHEVLEQLYHFHDAFNLPSKVESFKSVEQYAYYKGANDMVEYLITFICNGAQEAYGDYKDTFPGIRNPSEQEDKGEAR
jgi:hypothetical protein